MEYFILPAILAFSLIFFTFYSIYVGFGPPSENLRDPFDEHEQDLL